MGKRGCNPMVKQSSEVSANQLIQLLLANDFKVATLDAPVPDRDIKTAYRKDVRAARRQFGDAAMISITGRSVTFEGSHVVSGAQELDIRVPLSGMLGIGELEAIYKKTGIPQLRPPE